MQGLRQFLACAICPEVLLPGAIWCRSELIRGNRILILSRYSDTQRFLFTMPVDSSGQHRTSEIILTPWRINQLKQKQNKDYSFSREGICPVLADCNKPSRSTRHFTKNLQQYFKSSVVLGLTAFLLTSSGDGIEETAKSTMLIKTFLLFHCMKIIGYIDGDCFCKYSRAVIVS